MKDKRIFYLITAVLLAALLFAYAKSYDNAFHFDDSHTIVNNPYVRDISNIPLFFTKGPETFSTLPSNQSYRPLVTTTLAIDYWLGEKFYGDGYDPHFYHYSMMFTYILMLVLMYLMVIRIFDKAMKTKWNQWAALIVTSWYGLHVVNAETLNYIISRSDLLSTFFVVAAMVVYQYFPKQRKWGLFLIPFLIGMFAKLTTAMFIPIVMIYFALFEYPAMREACHSRGEQKRLIRKLSLQGILLVFVLLVSVAFVMSNIGQSFNPGGPSRWLYLITQPYVLLHYFISFFYAYNLSADTDMGLVSGLFSWRALTGLVFVAALLYFAVKKACKKECAPMSFGIFWFFISLAPTSSLIPLAEVANDHRMFFPFVGLAVSVGWILFRVIWKYHQEVEKSKVLKSAILLFFVLLFSAHIYAVRKRVEVWDNEKTLWYDVTRKSPENGRGWMNYGLQLMREGNYDEAMRCYREAQKYTPHYSYLYTNIAICQNAQGQVDEAEKNFKLALKYGANNHKPYYFYAVFLKKHGRNAEAVEQLKKSLEISPNYIFASYLLMEIYAEDYDWDALEQEVKRVSVRFPEDKKIQYYSDLAEKRWTRLDIALNKVKESPTVSNLLNLSLEYYNAAKFDSCIWASNEILKLDPNNVGAYNNICAANNQLRNWDKAIEAAQEGLRIEPNDQLLKNNMQVALDAKQRSSDWKNLSAGELLDLSLQYYRQGKYRECIDACYASLKKRPRNAVAYNNICSAYNQLHQWEKAIEAGEKALKYSPDFELAKNNLAYARKMAAESK